MKKIIVLGAMQMHVPLIKYAKERGYYVITVDYLLDAPGHKIADEYSLISTTDLEAVTCLARDKNVDIVMTFNSDPAAYTAAYVSKVLGLKGNPPKAVEIMSDKGLFRKFLYENGFNYPKYKVFSCSDEILSVDLDFPVIVKPVDSSGSKGITKVKDRSSLSKAFKLASEFSRCKKVIIEEFIEPKYNQLHGDAFVNNGKITDIFLGDHHFNPNVNGLVPYSTTFPSCINQEELSKVEREVERFIDLVGFIYGGINIEARINKFNNKVYLIEVGARNGGNFTYEVIKNYSNFDFLKALFDIYDNKNEKQKYLIDKYASYLIVHSDKTGILKKIELSDEIRKLIIDRKPYVKIGEEVSIFNGANSALEVLLLKSDQSSLSELVKNYDKHISVEC
ncbi:ATP-grasp domain-containing protein [Photobacterium leiognathi]|uniref:ATP-grasp domain-containing protein n=2 Tax=Photobacterium leiognathi TaxID=553611 RepID=UPI002739B55D|nr:ATP-grasp domain-containing protein [Photobacterium leiognathi]